MKTNKSDLILFNIFILIISLSPIMIPSSTNNQLLNEKSGPFKINVLGSSSFYISSNSGFATCSCVSSGNGSQSNPFIIKNYFINNASTPYGISISGTTDYFILQNIWVNGTASGPGITLSSVSNAILVNVTTSYNENDGIDISNSYAINVTNSQSFYNTRNGIYSFHGSFTNFTSINVNHNKLSGFYDYNSTLTRITNSRASFNGGSIYDAGFNNEYSKYENITNSQAFNNSVGMQAVFSYYNTFLNDTANFNTNDGLYIEQSNSNYVTNTKATGNGGIGLELPESNNSVITNCSFNKNFVGFQSGYSTGNTFFNSNATNNSNGGFGLGFVSKFWFNNSFVFNSSYGFDIEHSNFTEIEYSSSNNNSYAGIFLNDCLNSTLISDIANYNDYFGFEIQNSNSTIIEDNTGWFNKNQNYATFNSNEIVFIHNNFTNPISSSTTITSKTSTSSTSVVSHEVSASSTTNKQSLSFSDVMIIVSSIGFLFLFRKRTKIIKK